jgi:serine/threonine protein kinase
VHEYSCLMEPLPSLIGRYQIRQQLGQGGMGVLYLAFDPTMDRLVALKLLRVNDAQWRERFLREARLVARLQHPNIITVYDVGAHDGQPFMAMEYIDGNTLDTIVRRRVPLSRERKLEIMIALCDGLAYAHRFGVIHRDVKPSNLIVHRESGILKVLDFGIARTHDSSLTLVGAIMGTPNYMSPEQVQGQVVDHRSDVFAVGVVLYELFAHRQAFSGDTPFLILQDIVHSTPEPLAQIDPTIDPALAAIVERAISKDPQDRYPDLDVMRRELIDVLRHSEPDHEWGREKTAVLLARAVGASGGGVHVPHVPHAPAPPIAPPVALVTPPPSVGTEAGAIRTVDTPFESRSIETNVIPEAQLTPPPTTPLPMSPRLLEGDASSSASERPVSSAASAFGSRLGALSTLDALDETPRRAALFGLFESPLSRIGLLAAAVTLFIFIPIALLSSRSGGVSEAARASKPLASARLPRQAALLAPAIAPEPDIVALARAVSAGEQLTQPARPPAPSPLTATRGIAPPPPAVYEKPAERGDLKDMQETLDRWKRAYENRDVAAVTRVWPTISTAQTRSLDTAFGKMAQMTVLFRQCSLTGTVAHASATCSVERSIRFKSGRAEKVPVRMAFTLEKRADRWVIVSVRGA